MIVQIARAILLADAPILAVFDNRIFPVEMPEAVSFPACVLTKASGFGEYTLDGDSGIIESRLQVDVYGAVDDAKGYVTNIANKKLIRARLSGFRGAPPNMTGCVVMTSMCINDMDLEVPETDRAGPTLCRRMLEFRIIHKET